MTPDKMPTIDAIITIVRLQLGIHQVAAEDHLVERLSAASVDIVNIVATLEESFGIEIEEMDLANLQTVADLFSISDRLARAKE